MVMDTSAGLHPLRKKLLSLHFSFPLPMAWNIDVAEESDANEDNMLKYCRITEHTS